MAIKCWIFVHQRQLTVEKMKMIRLCLVISAICLAACQQNLQTQNGPKLSTKDPLVQQSTKIMMNQVGYAPSSTKIALVTNVNSTHFEVIDITQNKSVLKKRLGPSKLWQDSGLDVQIADFSELNTSGTFLIRVDGIDDSITFEITSNPYKPIHDAALKAYYFNRASAALPVEFAGPWSRQAAHPDTNVKVHTSAATQQRPEGYIISSPKGWYDAGDYNKYIVNSGISTYTLLSAYADFPAFYQQHFGQIPESSNDIPDILDEIKWNLDWMLTMQDPNDGGIYHKLTTLRFEGKKMPHNANAQRYVVKKSTSAALNFAAVMAYASKIYSDIPQYTAFSEQAKFAALDAWKWALQNPGVTYKNPEDVKTGQYDDEFLNDEFKWAAAELFLLTQEESYLRRFEQSKSPLNVPSWSNSSALAHISLLNHGKDQLPSELYQQLKVEFIAFADTIVEQHKDSPAQVAMTTPDYVWGSNGVAMNKSMVLLHAAKYAKDATAYRTAASGLLDYVLGRNPTGYSYVTGFGHKSPMDIHHRQSYADDVVAPIPGFVAGGPHSGRQDGCEYPSAFPAGNYADTWCSYSTNEVTINWNAPFVYVTAAIINAD